MTKLQKLLDKFYELDRVKDNQLDTLDKSYADFYETEAKYKLQDLDVGIDILKIVLTVSGSITVGLFAFQTTSSKLVEPLILSIVSTIAIFIVLLILLFIRHKTSKSVLKKIRIATFSTLDRKHKTLKRTTKEQEKIKNEINYIQRINFEKNLKQLKKSLSKKNLNKEIKQLTKEVINKTKHTIKEMKN